MEIKNIQRETYLKYVKAEALNKTHIHVSLDIKTVHSPVT